MLPLKRKSKEPLAAANEPEHVQALHESLQHFVADSPWSDKSVLRRVQSWVLPTMRTERKGWVFLIADDTGMPKAGTQSVAMPEASLPIKRQVSPVSAGRLERRPGLGARRPACPIGSLCPSRRSLWDRSRKPKPPVFPAISWRPMAVTATTQAIVTTLLAWGFSRC